MFRRRGYVPSVGPHLRPSDEGITLRLAQPQEPLPALPEGGPVPVCRQGPARAVVDSGHLPQ